MARWPVLAHLNAASLVDEGTEAVLDHLQDKAAATGVLLGVHGFNPEVMDRGRTWPGRGPKGTTGVLGGLFTEPAAGSFSRTLLGSPRVTQAPFGAFDALEAVNRAAKSRDLSVNLYILESASTGGWQHDVARWPQVLEIDIDGRRGAMPCVNHPDYRAWKLELFEGMYKAHEFDGLLWGVERWGPLHIALAGSAPTCFCTHCAAVAQRAGLDWSRVRQGYAALWRHCQAATAAEPGSGALVQLLLRHPEILGWEWQWTRSYLDLHRELYGVAKWLAPERRFGLGLWHYWFINPLLRAEWDMAEFAASADFIRPILYHVPEGPRIARYLGMLGRTASPGIARDAVWGLFKAMLGLDLPPIESFERSGLPASYVGQGVELVRRLSGGRAQVMAGIGIDVFEHGLDAPMAPEAAAAAVRAAHAAGADGITVSRNYAEMRHETLAAVGAAVRALGGAAP
jgi:hypothetical protein